MVAMDYSQPIASAAKGLLWRLVYSFHMPLFFMVSGYFLTLIGSDLTCAEKRDTFWKQLKISHSGCWYHILSPASSCLRPKDIMAIGSFSVYGKYQSWRWRHPMSCHTLIVATVCGSTLWHGCCFLHRKNVATCAPAKLYCGV